MTGHPLAPSSPSAGHAAQRYAIALIIGFTPLLAMVVTWNPAGLPTSGLFSLSKNLSLATLAAELLVILLAARKGLFRQPLRFTMPIGLAAAGFVIIAVATAIFVAPDTFTAVLWTTILAIHALFAWSIAYLCLSRHLALTDVTSCILAGFAAAIGALIVFVWQIDDPSVFNWVHGLPGFGNIRRLGYYAAPVVGLCLGRFTMKQRAGAQLATLAVATLALGTIFWSGSRGPVAAVAAGYLLGACLFPGLRAIRPLVGFLASSALAAALTAMVPVYSDSMGVGRIFGWKPEEATSISSDVTSGRTAIWLDTLDVISNRPLFGYGEGQARAVVPLISELQLVHPHNALLQALLAWGVVGTGLLLFLALSWAAPVIKYVRKTEGEYLPPMIGLMVIVAHAGLDGTLYHVQSLALFAALLGIAHVRLQENPNRLKLGEKLHAQAV